MPKKVSAQVRARKIKLLLFDVDGVLTDGKMYFLPDRESSRPGSAELSAQGSIEFKGFHAHDGVAISLARLAGLRTGLITKRYSETVALRARDLKLEFVLQGCHDKGAGFEQVVQQAGIPANEAAFVGDDIVDLPAMRIAGLAIAVQNARAEVKEGAHFTTPHAGGEGALRDAVEFILKAQGKWKKVLDNYLTQHPTVQ
ncbi:MAG TPA: HAD family hydrolase [Dongiaceae bacterium]|nr:HAD family hydrolase [Dongiaceae bacterium]